MFVIHKYKSFRASFETQKNLSILKQPALSVINDHLIAYPTPSNLNYFWGFGSLAGISLIIQIATGFFLACHYTPEVSLAFSSVEHIMRDVQGGFLLRYMHANGASMFFMVTMIHILRGLYYGSYQAPREAVWCVGVIILFLMIATAFMGYSLPFGQQSLWGISVITSLFSVVPFVGTELVQWLWGGFSVNNATLNRFFSLHYLLPFLIAGASIVHIAALHHKGSNNPLGINASADKINFYPYLVHKDRVGLLVYSVIFSILVWFTPNLLAHPDNNIPANSLVTPLSIVPEWYFCAPMRLLFRRGWRPSCVAMLCSKACPPHVTGNGGVRSGDKSTVSKGGPYEKLMRATFSMVKIINLNYSLTVLPWTLALLLLMGIEGYGNLPESEIFLDIVSLSHFSQMIRLQGPKLNTCGLQKTLALPKGQKPYGKRAAVVGSLNSEANEGQQVNDRKKIAFIIPKGCEKLMELRNNYKDTSLRRRLIHYIADENTLKLAYELIKSRPGNMTPGSTPETLDGIQAEYIQSISKKIRAGKYSFSPARQVWIPKPGKPEKRPLLIAPPREKIVQKAIELVLSTIYEPDFLPTSHGFRPNKSTHSALKMADVQFKGAVWFIEADITKCFDSIQHERLIKCLSKKIGCQKTLALIHSGLKAGYIKIGGVTEKALKGTPQGSVLSPLLCNIFLHELDMFMDEIRQKHEKGTRRRQDSRYSSVLNRIARQSTIEDTLKLKKELRRLPAGDPMDPHFTRIRYVRYADDFLISVTGPRKLASKIKEHVAVFLEQELGLEMNLGKTLVTKASKGPAFFLGTEITWRTPEQKKVVLSSTGRKVRITGRLTLKAPMEKLTRKMVERGFAKWDPSGNILTPVGLRRLQNMSHSDIISYYNSVARGTLNYYSFTDNRSSLGSVIRTLHMSCARTLALKYKLRYMSKVYKKFGSLLECPETKAKIYKPTTLKRTRQFNLSSPKTLEMLEKSWANKLTKSNLGKSCIMEVFLHKCTTYGK